MKKTILTLLALTLAVIAQAQTITHVFHYGQPVMNEREGYYQIDLEGCLPSGMEGEPTLPWQSVSLILPQGQEAVSLQVELSDFVELDDSFELYPYQKPRPISCTEAIPFAKDEALYRSSLPYPTRGFESVSTQYLNGVAFAFGGFSPVRYVPATGRVSYARTVSVSIETVPASDNHSRNLWLTPDNEASIRRLAQNPDLLDTYPRRGREIGGYDMLVITGEEWVPRFGEYLDLYNGKGIRTHIVSLEDIYAAMSGCDEQEQIRNYIIQEYEENGISMVNLGGDVSIVPYRSLYCFAQEGYEDQLPADMYYACLDGTLNDDGDDLWGEVGEDDLLPELGIGRLPFNNVEQFNTIMGKTISYLLDPVLGEFTSPILGAEHLGDGYYGSDDMERLIGESSDFDYTTFGYPTDYDFKKYYATPTFGFSGGGFKMVIGTGGQYVHHVGHANTDFVAGWEGTNMGDHFFAGNNGVDHNYMLFHSHGCICGDFSHSCVLEKMVTIQTGFVVTTGNSRYGWYVPWGDGMAAHIHREFVDAYCHDLIPSVGMALREAKIATAPWVTAWGEEGCLRWNIYCLNVIGDGALYPWFDEPFDPNVVYEDGLSAGTSTTTVHVSHFDEALANFSVSLFDGDILLARGLTDTNGDAELSFDPALSTTGALQLIVTGRNAWPQVFDVNAIGAGEAYVYGNIVELDGLAEFNTNRWVGFELYNKGDVTAYNIQAEVTTDCEYINIPSNNFTLDELAANGTAYFEHGTNIDIADNIPDQTIFTLELTALLGDDTHTTRKSFLAMAPNLQFVDFDVDDSEGNNNGFIDPGERITLHVNCVNAGHATAPDAFLSFACDDDRVHLEGNTAALGGIDSDGSFTADIVFTTDPDVLSGTTFYLDMELHTGAYTTPYQYVFADGVAVETFETGDFSFMLWEHSGDEHWFITDDETHNGTFSARSGAIADDEVSYLSLYADLLIGGEISFWFKTSTEYHRDYFAFLIDGKKKDWWSGENDWTYASYEVEAGSHVFLWLYDKSKTGEAGFDCAWIDDITLPRNCMVTGVEEAVLQKSVTVYPNPNNGAFFIDLTEESDVAIYNSLGQCVATHSKMSGTQQFHLDHAGLYLIRISNSEGVISRKLIVE